MIIGASSVGMNSSRNYKSNSRQVSYLQAWDNSTGESLRYWNGAADSFVSDSNSEDNLKESAKNLFENLRERQEKALEEETGMTTASDESLESSKADENTVGVPDDGKPKKLTGEELLEKAASDLKYSLDSVSAPKMSNVNEKLEQLKQIRMQTIQYLMRLLFGRDWKGATGASNDTNLYYATENVNGGNFTSMSGYGQLDSSKFFADGEICLDNMADGVGGSYYNYYEYSEKESVQFNTTGTVVTQDGREIEFNVSLSMSRSFYEASETYIDFGAVNCTDPLVINLEGNVTSVEDQKFFFDLDADGKEEEISRLSQGSGYLALDKNGDGIINDGSELFGTESGNGFADLARYDADGNGWIDEADEIFEKLLIWQMDAEGNSSLVGLGKAGVGAIYLGSESTEFSLKDSENNTNAVIRKTGIFIYEDGNVGTMSQLDLAT